jgi:LacI family transcriptional regulator
VVPRVGSTYLAVSIKDVAAKAAVSIATVSHVLNGTRVTRPRTRDRVLAAVRELNYSQNQAARNLARGTSSILGLIVSDVRNPFFPEITAAFQDQALAHNMDAIMLNTNYDAQRTLHSVRRLLGLQVPGVAVFTSQIEPSIVNILAERRVAAVYLDLGTVSDAVSNIVLDYEGGIAQALEHLTGLGHSRIGYIGGPGKLHSVLRRKNSFIANAKRLGIDSGILEDSDFSVKGGYLACSKLLDGGQKPTAIVAGNDLTAIGILHYAYDSHLRVPDDLSVVGFDDILFAAYTQPALTTVAVPRAEVGKTAFEALWAMLADSELKGREYKLATHLVIRESTAKPTD